ncbi:glycosyltransferase family 2 protein [Kangiella sp. HZ709]|uniref:glycosyltransferase family 2 protein n=1 Tax=Kangiella sp. HZ709 TaxID=2666328 RepID=UPI0012AF6B4C|nr:glycosyltransferase family 2 protein [Kangiella sp. HZ709]MRX26665.1 glycosyltransferase [Kangiella sp. HZ709]
MSFKKVSSKDFDSLRSKGLFDTDSARNQSIQPNKEMKANLRYLRLYLNILFLPAFEFIKWYLFKGFLLKGIDGFVFAVQQSYSKFLIQAKSFEYFYAEPIDVNRFSKADTSIKSSHLSIYMIVKNEEQTIETALSTTLWADEVVVVDSGSSDSTVDKAKELGATVLFNAWQGFPHQKQYALEQCHNDWVYSMDADEWITLDLQSEIIKTMQQDQYTSLRCLRNDLFMGKPLSGLCKLPHNNRLFIRNSGKYDLTELSHENPKVHGRERKTSAFFYHTGYNQITKLVDKLSLYANLKAKERHLANKKYSKLKIIIKFPVMLLKNLIINRYIVMGMRGFVFSAIYAYYAFQKEYMLFENYFTNRD